MTLQKFIELLKKCHTLETAGRVFVAGLLSDALTNSEKTQRGDIYTACAEQLTK
jgi:hypothetical protein